MSVKLDEQFAQTPPSCDSCEIFIRGKGMCERMKRVIRVASNEYFTQSWGKDLGTNRIFALHGWMDNSNSFNLLAPHIASQGYYIVGMDFLGHGRSSHSSNSSGYHIPDHVIDVKLLMDELQWNNCSLLCHSMGVAVGMILTATYPELVTKIVMLEGLGPLSFSAANPIATMRRAIEVNTEKLKHLKPTAREYEGMEEAIKARLSSDPNMAYHSAREIVLGGSTQLPNGKVVFSHDPRLKFRSPRRFSEEEVREYLVRIKCPKLLVLATKGLIFPAIHEDALRQDRISSLAPVEQVVLEGGHHVHSDRAGEVSKVVVEFMKPLGNVGVLRAMM